ncbi:MAG: Integrase catalytic region [Acidobacteria bacterium]|jgi:transposase-like protein|nr:Integrase catalytic region [Acidobacteriota bacterium]
MATNTPNDYRYRFPQDIISHAVWLYYRFCLSFRDVEDLLAQRGIIATYETIRPMIKLTIPGVSRSQKERSCKIEDFFVPMRSIIAFE